MGPREDLWTPSLELEKRFVNVWALYTWVWRGDSMEDTRFTRGAS